MLCRILCQTCRAVPCRANKLMEAPHGDRLFETFRHLQAYKYLSTSGQPAASREGIEAFVRAAEVHLPDLSAGLQYDYLRKPISVRGTGMS